MSCPGGADREDPLARDRRVNQTCDRFEDAWKRGTRPRIEDWLGMVPRPDQPALLVELIALEIEMRTTAGERPEREEYRERFPGANEAIELGFASLTDRSPREAETAAWLEGPITEREADPPGPPLRPGAGGRAQDAPPGTGECFGEYILLEEIARGGMGVVYKARQPGTRRLVALKTILAGSMASSEQRARFLREAQLAQGLEHDNIVPIYHVGEHDGLLYFTMRFVEGGSLAGRIFNYLGDPRGTARLIATLARAVHHAHQQGFIHCDLKPSNILLDTDRKPQITDFGLARTTSEDSSLTATGAVLGTPSYMAPEQAAGARSEIGPATDVYGLGAILYELLTGRPPFRSGNIMETFVQVLERDPRPPHDFQPAIPRELESICLRCLEKPPAERYTSALLLAQELERFLDGEVIDASTTTQQLRRWTRREPELVTRLLGLGLIITFTQVNYAFVTSSPDLAIHCRVQAILGLWAISSVLLQLRLRHSRGAWSIPFLWSACDVLFYTMAIYVLRRVDSPLIVGYALIIAAAGLSCRVGVVWFTTVASCLSYAILYLEWTVGWDGARFQWNPRAINQYPNIILSALVVTGFVVVRQVKRMLALSRYYQDRN